MTASRSTMLAMITAWSMVRPCAAIASRISGVSGVAELRQELLGDLERGDAFAPLISYSTVSGGI